MIYPTRQALFFAGIGVLVAILISASMPNAWFSSLVIPFFLMAVMAGDALMARRGGEAKINVQTPSAVFIGRVDQADFAITFPAPHGELPKNIETKIDVDSLFVIEQKNATSFSLTPLRRGVGKIRNFWLRWQGPLGLVWVQRVEKIDREIAILPDMKSVEEEAVKLFVRNNAIGAKLQIDKGEGAEFDSLRDYQSGMDPRSIDWKHTARHRSLVAKEFQTERNHSIMFAIDTGRLMSQPLKKGVSRLDQAINTSLILAFVSLKIGDRVGFFGFDEKPCLTTGFVSGARSFNLLRGQAASLNYTSNETNFTLGLTELSSKLDRRSLVVIFTDFTDSTSAELMISNISSLLKQHLVIFVAFRDRELEAIAAHAPDEADDVTRAVIADDLLRERDVVITKLRRLGVQIIDVPSDKMGAALLNRYLSVKERNML